MLFCSPHARKKVRHNTLYKTRWFRSKQQFWSFCLGAHVLLLFCQHCGKDFLCGCEPTPQASSIIVLLDSAICQPPPLYETPQKLNIYDFRNFHIWSSTLKFSDFAQLRTSTLFLISRVLKCWIPSGFAPWALPGFRRVTLLCTLGFPTRRPKVRTFSERFAKVQVKDEFGRTFSHNHIKN